MELTPPSGVRAAHSLGGGVRAGDVWRSLRTIGGTPPNAFDLRKSFGVNQKQPSYWKWRSVGDGWLKKPRGRAGPHLKTKGSMDQPPPRTLPPCRMIEYCELSFKVVRL